MSLWSTLTREQKVEAVRLGLAAGDSRGAIARRLGTTRGAVSGFLHFHPEAREEAPHGGHDRIRGRQGVISFNELAFEGGADSAALSPPHVAAKFAAEIPAIRLAAARIVQTRQLTLLEVCDGYCRWPMWSRRSKPAPAEQFVCSAAAPLDRPYCRAHAAAAKPISSAEAL